MKIVKALLIWLGLLILSLGVCTQLQQNNWLNGLSLLANIVQVLSTVVLYHLFMKVHILHKHVKHLTQNQEVNKDEIQEETSSH